MRQRDPNEISALAARHGYERLSEGDRIPCRSYDEAREVFATFRQWCIENDVVLSSAMDRREQGWHVRVTCKAEYKHRAEREKWKRSIDAKKV